eukprot:gi/632984043/ref/XP_007908945.1/ PREDICTED: uncharacterized protein LOC103190098 [Callorhinchus milii]
MISVYNRSQEVAAMRKNPRKIQVMKIPEILPIDRMEDKLIIHFQRHSNGGGEVLDVEYLTGSRCSAYVTFEKEEDAQSVLRRQHLLILHEGCFPLQVREVTESQTSVDKEQVMVYVTTSLDMRDFPVEELWRLLRRHGLEIVSRAGPWLEIRGSFPALKLFRSELLGRSRSRSRSWSEEEEAKAAQGRGARPKHKQNGDSYRDQMAASPSVNDHDGHSIAAARADGRGSRRAKGNNADRGKQSSASLPADLTFPVDEAVMKYLLMYKMAGVRALLDRHSVELQSEPSGDGFANVCVFPKPGFGGVPGPGDLLQVQEELCRHVQVEQNGLRQLTIELTTLSSRQKKTVKQRLDKILDSFQVVWWRESETIHLIGTSSESYFCHQYLLGEELPEEDGESCRRGRDGKRSQHVQGRTSSCPASRAPTDQANRHRDQSPPVEAKSKWNHWAHSTRRAKRTPLAGVDTDWVDANLLEAGTKPQSSHSWKHRKSPKFIKGLITKSTQLLHEKSRKDKNIRT